MHKKFMLEALKEANKSTVKVFPNPKVGAIIVKNNTIISKGHHKKFGSNHAEIEAIEAAPGSVRGSTLYVTLEPCSHHGKTPSCADRIIKEGIICVYIASIDPNPLVNGLGIKKLKDANISVHIGLLDKENRELNKVFFHFIINKRPFVTYKTAMTMDGKTKTINNDSKWISSSKSRQRVQDIRNNNMAIMVGVSTIIEDNPYLTNRTGSAFYPTRIILDSSLKTPLNSNVLKDTYRTIIFTTFLYDKKKYNYINNLPNKEIYIIDSQNSKVDLLKVMDKLYHMNINSILLESGETLSNAMLINKLIDEIYFFYAPKLIGASKPNKSNNNGILSIENSVSVINRKIEFIDDDILITGALNYVHRNN